MKIRLGKIEWDLVALRGNLDEAKSMHKEAWEKEILSFLEEWWDDSEEIQIKTSGSTGVPKKMKVKKAAMKLSAARTKSHFELDTGINALLCLPAQFIASKMMIVRALEFQWNTICVKPSLSPLTELRENIGFAALVPLQIQSSLSDSKLDLLEKIIIGGAPLHPNLEAKIKYRDGIYATYGMTETLTHVASRPLGGDPTFRAINGNHFKLDDRGCLSISSNGITDGFIHTNDIVELIDERHFIWKGRIDNVINSGGLKIIPEEIESKISQFIKYPFYISSKSDDLLGEMVVLVLEGEINETESNVLLKLAGTHLGKHEKPRDIICEKEFERTFSGKIKRRIFQ